jgi:histidinol-phosphatase (PHP family)
MEFSSLHTHTVFCDGRDDVETMCRAAFEKGLAAIGFSAHAPIGITGLETSWHLRDERLGEYIDEVNAARRRWEGRLTVYLGLEVDYIKGLRSPLDKDIQGLNMDYLIGSVHYLVPPRGQPFTVDGPAAELEKGMADGFGGLSAAAGEAVMNAYWDAVAEMIALGGFDIVGHLDLVKKNNNFNGKQNYWFNEGGSPYSGDYLRRAEEIVRAISSRGLVVEVNTGGINRGYFAETYPSPAILGLLLRHNVPVMISADAHNAGDLDGHYETARRALFDAGYRSHVLFEGRVGGEPMWREHALTVSK